MQPRPKPRRHVCCWTRSPVDVELQEYVDGLLPLAVGELRLPVCAEHLYCAFDPRMMTRIESFARRNGIQLDADVPELLQDLFLRAFLKRSTLRANKRQRSESSHDRKVLILREVPQPIRG